METKLARIAQLSKENPDMVFTSVGHLINKEMFRDCHEKMDGDKAVGIDGVSRARKDHAAENLSIIRHICLNMLKQEKICKMGLKSKRKKCGWDLNYRLKVLKMLATDFSEE